MKILDRIDIKRPPTMREEVFKYLREKILGGEIPPKSKLNESKLAEEIGASRTPVREALHNLEMERLIESVPRVGYVVKEITENDVEEIIQIRIALESLAAKWACQRISSRQLAQLEKIIRLTDRGIERKNTQRVVQLDTKFHEIICKASQSRRIEEISQSMRDYMVRFRIKGLSVPEIARKSNEGHTRILEALRTKNSKRIESAVRYHLNWTKRHVVQVIRKD
jgi:DNA-binding GntR family transcriptional regulator